MLLLISSILRLVQCTVIEQHGNVLLIDQLDQMRPCKSIKFDVYIQNKLLWLMPVMGTHSSYELGCVSRTVG